MREEEEEERGAKAVHVRPLLLCLFLASDERESCPPLSLSLTRARNSIDYFLVRKIGGSRNGSAKRGARRSTDSLRVNHPRRFGADSTGSSLKATVPVFRRHGSTNSARVEVVGYVGGLEERRPYRIQLCKLVIRHNPRLMAADQQVTGVGGRHCFL